MTTKRLDQVRIFVIEDDPIIQHDIALTLESHGARVVGEAYDAIRAIDLLDKMDLDIVILDIHLGKGQSGIDIAKIIHERMSLPYIFLTSYSDEATLDAAEQYGPYGYLVKPFQEETLISTIKIALSNFSRQYTKKAWSLPTHLTDRERQLCHALISGKNYQEIADHLHISINTVRYHIKGIYSKMDVSSRPELLQALMS